MRGRVRPSGSWPARRAPGRADRRGQRAAAGTGVPARGARGGGQPAARRRAGRGGTVAVSNCLPSGAAPAASARRPRRAARRVARLTPRPAPPRSEAFDLFDTDGSGTIDAKELKVAMRCVAAGGRGGRRGGQLAPVRGCGRRRCGLRCRAGRRPATGLAIFAGACFRSAGHSCRRAWAGRAPRCGLARFSPGERRAPRCAAPCAHDVGAAAPCPDTRPLARCASCAASRRQRAGLRAQKGGSKEDDCRH